MGGGGDKFSSGTFDDPKHIVDGPGLTRTLYSVVRSTVPGLLFPSRLFWLASHIIAPRVKISFVLTLSL